MTGLNDTPDNLNMLSTLNHRFTIKKAPHINFFLQRFNIPFIHLPAVATGNPFVSLPQTGDHIQFGELHIDFKVDEDLKNYLEIQTWIFALGFPHRFEEYKALADIPSYTGNGLRSDLSLIILDSHQKAVREFVFHDAFPIGMTDLEFSTTDPDVKYLTCGASFVYSTFTVQNAS